MKIKNYELLVAIAGDEPKPLLQYGHEGHTFVEGKPGTEFCFVFRNNSSDRIEVVPSLDGLSCMDGEPATDRSSGYVVEPYRRLVIKGWRTSLEKSAAFTFERKKDGYAKAIGESTENVGVIGALVYREKKPELSESEVWRRLRQVERDLEREKNRQPIIIEKPYPVYPSYPKPYWGDVVWMTTSGNSEVTSFAVGGNGQATSGEFGGGGASCDNSGNWMCYGGGGATLGTAGPIQIMNCSVASEKVHQEANSQILRSAVKTKFNLAAGWGKEQKDEVREVRFERGELDAEFAIYYTDRKALKDMGIELDPKPAVTKLPQAFVRAFCKPPKK